MREPPVWRPAAGQRSSSWTLTLCLILGWAACRAGPNDRTPSPPAMNWVPSPYFRAANRTPSTVDAIAIHTTEGHFRDGVSHADNQRRNYRGTINYFQDNERGVSAHFVVGPGGEVTRMVRERDIAVTTTYYNARSIGIECAGWGDRAATWTPELLDALVDLCAHLCVTWDVPAVHPEGTAYEGPHRVVTDDPDRPHFDAPGIVAHAQVQPWNKSDPGPYFPWQEFIARVRRRISGSQDLATANPAAPIPAVPIPAPAREFRAAWVASVGNIDWPSAPGLPVDQQQVEALAILDQLIALRMNAVVLQVRPQADALYDSALEPWSYYLTGAQGRAPAPYYDPLNFWIDAAHARGIALHAWFNPYRANHPANAGGLCEQSIVKARPELVVQLGDEGYFWMDPALPAVRDHSIAVVMDVVRRYDIDGVHFDDYFYPYRSYNDGRDFPDDRSWGAYRAGGGTLARNDWRRAAVDEFIERLHREIKATKPHVEFGISPFGIWRPGHPPGIQGLDQYDVLYADAKLWLNRGWVDYFTPQLYWPIARVPQSFPVLLGWWQRQNQQARHLWPGTSIGRARGTAGATEIVNQIMITRGMVAASPGICMFSMKSLLARPRLAARLVDGPFAAAALIPASPWLDDQPPMAPAVRAARTGAGVAVSWTPRGSEAANLWVVWALRGETWTHDIVPGCQRDLLLVDDAGVRQVAVAAVDRCRNASIEAVAAVE